MLESKHFNSARLFADRYLIRSLYLYLTALLIALLRATTIDDYEALLPWRIQLDT